MFDFDYTLGDSTKGIISSVNFALNKLGYQKKDEEIIRKTIGLSLKDTFFELEPEGKESEAEEFSLFFKEKADEVMVPNPEGLLLAIDRLQLQKDDILYVGDSLVDAKTAENAGVSFAAVLTGTTSREDFEPYRTVHVGNGIKDIYEKLKA